MKNIRIVLVIHNVRSTHNVGSLLRSADGFDVERVYLTGYTPYPVKENDVRLPYLREKIERQINKTALGAQNSVFWSQDAEIQTVIEDLKEQEFLIAALEQANNSIELPDFKSPDKLAIIVGREVEGIEHDVLKLADTILEIPMLGQKESFNVAVAGAIALYQSRYG